MSEGRSLGEGRQREGEGRGEGQHPPEYKSPIAQKEIRQKEHGDPAEKQKEQERINRDESGYRAGFPVAGHARRERDNDPGRSR